MSNEPEGVQSGDPKPMQLPAGSTPTDWTREEITVGRQGQEDASGHEGNKMADDMTDSDGDRLPRTFKMRRREYLLSEAPQYLRDAFSVGRILPIEEMTTNGMTLHGVRYRIYRDAAARETAKGIGIDELDKAKMENPSHPVDPGNPPADERPAGFYAHEIVREFARLKNLDRVTWWPLLLSEAQAQVLEHLIDLQGTFAVRPTAAQMLDTSLAVAGDGKVSDEQFKSMLEALRSKR